MAAYPADLARSADREGLVEFVLEEYERIALLVHAAGGPTVAEDLLELTPDGLAKALEAYLTAPLFLAQLVANEMVRLTEAGAIDTAKIVLINSLAAETVVAERPAHCLAAAGVASLVRLLADRLGDHGVNVYELRTGLVSIAANDAVHARYDRPVSAGLTPIRRLGHPQDVAFAVAAVADDLLPFSTGEVIHVDGGFHLRRL